MNAAVSQGMADAMDRLDADAGLSVGILTGAGGSFCAGMDLKAFARGENVVVEGRGMGFTERPPVKPLIAAVEGYCLAGGMELALATDLIVASKESAFGIPEVKRGLVAGGGGLLRLPQRIPYAVAMELALTGEQLLCAAGTRTRIGERCWPNPARRWMPRSAWPRRSPRTGRWPLRRPSGSSSSRAVGAPRRCGPSRTRSWRRCSCPTTPGGRGGVRREAPAEVDGQLIVSERRPWATDRDGPQRRAAAS